MKLSQAMMLGSTTCKMVPNDWNSCALGASANAIGIGEATPKHFFDLQILPDGTPRASAITSAWPWLNASGFSRTEGYSVCAIEAVWSRFDNEVCRGSMTLEQLADYVASIEPSCGECNRFKCSCIKTSDGAEGLTEAKEDIEVLA